MRDLLKFFVVTFALSWTCFISTAVISSQTQTTSTLSFLQEALVLLGTFSPSIVALWLTARSGIPGAIQTLLERIGKWKVNVRWYVFAVTYIAVVKILVALIYRITTGSWPVFGKEAWYIIIVAVFFSTWVQAGEEVGWRGFALPRMSEKFGLPVATMILGVIWACWHLPLFFVKEADKFGQSFPLYLLQVTALSIAIGWLYWRTQGSLLLVMLMHAAGNNTKDIVPSTVAGAANPLALSHSLVAWLTVTLLWICALYFLVRMRGVNTFQF